MKHSDSLQHLAPAFVEICGNLENPARNREVTVKTSRGAYEFSYATLDSILDLVRPILKEHKCALTHAIYQRDGVNVMEARIIHESGEWMSSEVELVLNRDDPQKVASMMTYYRRYTLCGLLPIAGLEDDAGSAASDRAMQEGQSTKGLMTGKELSEKHAAEFFERDNYTIAVRDNDFDQWRGWVEALIKWAGAPPILIQLWNDNEDTLSAIGSASFNRLKKLRNKRFTDDWAMDIPLEWQDGVTFKGETRANKPQPDMLESEPDGE